VLRSILVALDGSAYSEPVTAFALDWAVRYGARLVGVGVLDEDSIHRPEAVPLGGGAYKIARDKARMADAHRHVLAFLGDFAARARAAGAAVQAVEDVGDPAEQLVREAERCDVVVLGRETFFRFESPDRPDATLAQVLRASPRPLVIVPRELPAAGDRVMIAYGGGREAARTLQTFQLLGLAAGDDLEVVTIHPDGARAEVIAARAGDFLASHGTRHRLHPVVTPGAPADVLLELIHTRRCRLLVMGAHAHHPLRDLFGTSVTRGVLAGCPVPIFIGA
jgi:nucleotide-binding universal stress UspA family protein